MHKKQRAHATYLTGLAIMANGWREELLRLQDKRGEMPADWLTAVEDAQQAWIRAEAKYGAACAREVKP